MAVLARFADPPSGLRGSGCGDHFEALSEWLTTECQTPRPKTPLSSVRPGRSEGGTGVSSQLPSWTWSIDNVLCIGLRLMSSPVQSRFSSSSDGNQRSGIKERISIGPERSPAESRDGMG